MADRRILYEWGARQRGLVTRADLVRLGVSVGRRRTLVADGTLQRLGAQTFRIAGSPLDQRGRVQAACLEVDGVASHRTAAWLHGLRGWGPPDPPQVLRLGRKAVYRNSLGQVHTTTWLPPDDRIVVDGIPCTTVARTLFNLASMVPEVPEESVRGAVEEAIRGGLASDPWLWWRLEKLRCRGRRGVSAFERILAARLDAPTESWLERQYLRISDDAGLPRPVCQARIARRGAFVARVDFAYEDRRIVIEVTGAVGHSSPQQRGADAARRNRLARAGYLVLEFTYEQVVQDPARVIAEVRMALAGRLTA